MNKFTRLITFSLIAILISGCAGCGMFVSKAKAKAAAEKQGYTNVVINDKDIFFIFWNGCGKDDDVSFEATATNSNGETVEIIICAGFPFKGVTIRTY